MLLIGRGGIEMGGGFGIGIFWSWAEWNER